MADPITTSLVGKKFGKYQLTRLIGIGATADVYEAKDRDGNSAAIKVLTASVARDSDMLKRFKREADAARSIDHPHVIDVLDVGSSRGRHYIVMELMRGGSLRDLLNRKHPAVHKVVNALAQVAEVLARAHEKGIVHRDLKPANVLLNRVGRSKLADFGLARNPDNSTSLTTDGRMLGTAAYMSPEQARGRRAEPASDVYSLGVMVYEAISGAPPFDAQTPYGFIYKHVEVKPDRPRLRRGYPRSLARLAMRCMEKEPARRPAMSEVAIELREAADDLRLGRRSLWRRSRAALLYGAATLLVIAGVFAAFPEVLDPLCKGGDGSDAVCAVQRAAERVHNAVTGH